MLITFTLFSNHFYPVPYQKSKEYVCRFWCLYPDVNDYFSYLPHYAGLIENRIYFATVARFAPSGGQAYSVVEKHKASADMRSVSILPHDLNCPI